MFLNKQFILSEMLNITNRYIDASDKHCDFLNLSNTDAIKLRKLLPVKHQLVIPLLRTSLFCTQMIADTKYKRLEVENHQDRFVKLIDEKSDIELYLNSLIESVLIMQVPIMYDNIIKPDKILNDMLIILNNFYDEKIMTVVSNRNIKLILETLNQTL